MKKIRNDLFHNREQYTQIECCNLAQDFKDVLGELHKILYNWDEGIVISSENKKTDAAIDKIMKGAISREEFKYMCLQKVLNHIVEPVLNTVVTLICYKKTEDNFLEFFRTNGMNRTNIKNAFFKEEKITLESNLGDFKLDVTLCCKIIEICKNWHDILANDYLAKRELSNIISNIRDLRNHISHNIFSMTQEECNDKAYRLGSCLEDLANFVKKKKMYTKLNVPVIDAQQIFSAIGSIMSIPYSNI